MPASTFSTPREAYSLKLVSENKENPIWKSEFLESSESQIELFPLIKMNPSRSQKRP